MSKGSRIYLIVDKSWLLIKNGRATFPAGLVGAGLIQSDMVTRADKAEHVGEPLRLAKALLTFLTFRLKHGKDVLGNELIADFFPVCPGREKRPVVFQFSGIQPDPVARGAFVDRDLS